MASNSGALALFQGRTKGDRMIILGIATGWTVTDGPSREEIFDALRLFNEQRYVNFVLADQSVAHPQSLPAKIMGIRPEDGSGHNWLLTVTFRKASPSSFWIGNTDTYELYYSSKRRSGSVLDATSQAERIRLVDGAIWKGAHKVGDVPAHLLS